CRTRSPRSRSSTTPVPAFAAPLTRVSAVIPVISGVFWWAILFAVLVPLLAAFIKEVPLRGGTESAKEAEAQVPVLD
ncbi:hypothetical protein ACWCSH_46015, partial [Streptosporangium sp. NPDC001682]